MEGSGGLRNARRRDGFTLVELMVTLAIVGIFALIAAPSLTAFVHHAQFQHSEACARTLYLDAEANLAHLRAAGLWEDFKEDLLAAGEPAALSESPQSGTHEIRGVLLNGSETGGGAKARVLERLIGEDTYDSGFLDACICVEVDVTSGHVYAVFYSTATGALSYAPGTGGYLGERGYASRLERRLGCYPAGGTEPERR